MKKEKWYVYMVQCADNTLYTGITNNVEKRVAVHNSGKGAKYTRSRMPVKLAYYETLKHKGDALKREGVIKRWPRKKKLACIAA